MKAPYKPFKNLDVSAIYSSYKAFIYAYLLANGMKYMINPRFISAYRTRSLPEAIDAVSNEPGCHGASCRQFDEVDNQILYAALIVAVSCVKVLPILDKYAVTTDGLSAYLDIQDTYDNTGNLLLKIAELIERFQTPWSPGYVGGVPAYLDHICGAFGLMDREDIDFLHHPLYSEGQKISNVYSRFRNSEQSQLMETVHNKFQADVHQHTVPATVDSFVMQIKSSHRYLSSPTAIPRIRGYRSAMLGAVQEEFDDMKKLENHMTWCRL